MTILPIPNGDSGFNFVALPGNEVEQSDKPMPSWIKILLVSMILLIIFSAGILIDGIVYNHRYQNSLFYTKDCAFQVPEGYKITYSDTKKMYAVRVLQFGDYYLYTGKYGPGTMFSSIAEPDLFFDSCTAKAYLKSYLKDKEPRAKDFK